MRPSLLTSGQFLTSGLGVVDDGGAARGTGWSREVGLGARCPGLTETTVS